MVTEIERAGLAQQLLDNPIFGEIMAKIERDAIEVCVYADGDEARLRAAYRVQAVRSFREDCEAMASNNLTRRVATV